MKFGNRYVDNGDGTTWVVTYTGHGKNRKERGKEHWILIDTKNIDKVCTYTWCAYKNCGTWYALAHVKKEDGTKTTLLMHVLLMGIDTSTGQCVDHINRNGLDNREENLRICRSNIENLQYMPGEGVQKVGSKYRATINFRFDTGVETICSRLYDTREDALMVVKVFRSDAFRAFYMLNRYWPKRSDGMPEKSVRALKAWHIRKIAERAGLPLPENV